MALAIGESAVIAVMLIMVAGALMAAGGPAVLRRLPEPIAPSGADDPTRAEYATKISYRSLVGRRFVGCCIALSLLAMVVAAGTRPAADWSCWLVFSTIGVLLAAVDAVTSWLPSALIYPGWLAMAAAIVITVALTDGPRPAALIMIIGSALIAGVGYLLLWLITAGRSVAFGDVRLMPLVGAVAGTMGWPGLYWSILLGSVIGAVIGIVRLLAHRRGPFPYAPALVAGPYATALLLAIFR